MTNKKFTVAAVVAAAITAAPIAAPALGAIAPVFADTTTTTTTPSQTSAYTGTSAITNGSVTVYTGNATAKTENSLIYNNSNITIANNGADYAQKYTTYKVLSMFTRKSDGAKFYVTSDSQFLPVNDFNFTPTGDTAKDTTLLIGSIKINGSKDYGVQVWTKDGKMVRFNKADANYWNSTHPKVRVKAGDPKKLTGQSSWKIYNATYTANGTTYYNLGSDQYIDVHYATLLK